MIEDRIPSLTPDNDILHQFKASSAAGGMIISIIIPRGAIMDIIIPLCSTAGLELVKNVIVRSQTRDSVFNHPSGSKKNPSGPSLGQSPRDGPSGFFLSPSGMIKSRIPRFPHDNATLSFPEYPSLAVAIADN